MHYTVNSFDMAVISTLIKTRLLVSGKHALSFKIMDINTITYAIDMNIITLSGVLLPGSK